MTPEELRALAADPTRADPWFWHTFAPDLARLCAEQHEMLGKAADTLADLAVSLRLLRHTTLATAVDIAETHTRAALAKMGELEARCDLDH